jgi:hypothetical protein
MGRFQIITPPATEPVTAQEAMTHLKQDDGSDIDLVSGLITAARLWCEVQTEKQFLPAAYQLTLDSFYDRDWCYWEDVGLGPLGLGYGVYRWIMRLPRPPLMAIQSITYVDTSGNLQVLDPSQYQVDAFSEQPARVSPAYGKIWPVARVQLAAVQVNYTAGYASAPQVPANLKAAIKLLVGHWYVNREAVGQVGGPVEMAVAALLGISEVGGYG